MGAAMPKTDKAEDLTNLQDAELLKILAREVKIESATNTAREAYQLLIKSAAVRDIAAAMKEAKAPAFHEVRELGLATIKDNARRMREDWAKEVIRVLQESNASGRHMTRRQLVNAIKSYCFTRRYTGKNGAQIKEGTITRWLTLDLEQQLRGEALTLR